MLKMNIKYIFSIFTVAIFFLFSTLVFAELINPIAENKVSSSKDSSECLQIKPRKKTVLDNCQNKCCNMQAVIDQPIKTPTDGVLVSKDFLSLAQAVVQSLGLIFTIMSVVFGVIVAVNVYQGNSVLKEAKEELALLKDESLYIKKAKQEHELGLAEIKTQSAQILNDLKIQTTELKKSTEEALRIEAEKNIQKIAELSYRATTLASYIPKILFELDKVNSDESILFPLVTALFGNKDAEVLDVYIKCIQKLPKDSELNGRILKHGLNKFTENGIT